MSKENNLTDFLTDVASAIKDKRGIGSVNAQNFSTEIRAIEPLLDTLDITENGEHNVKDYKNVSVLVESEADIKLKEFIEKTNTTNVFEVPYGLTKIGSGSLSSYTKFIIPNTVTFFNRWSFQTSNYYSIYYNGTFEQYINIEKGKLNGSNLEYFSADLGSKNPSYYYLYLKNDNGEFSKVQDNILINGITNIPLGSLSCLDLTSVNLLTFSKDITNIGEYSFAYFRVGNLVFEDDCEVNIIPAYCFTNAIISNSSSKRGKIILPKCEQINTRAFQNVTASEIVFKEGLLYIYGYSMYGAKLEKLTLPQSLKTIGDNALYNVKGITELIIPKNVSEVQNNGLNMGGSSTNEKVTFIIESETPFTISSSTFFKNYINKIYVPRGTSETFKSATNWSNFASYIYEKYIVVMNVPSALLNNETITYSIDGGKTYQQFTNGVLSLNEVATIKIKSTDSSQVVKIGTSEGASDVGTISNSELTFSFTTDTNVYLTIQ